MLKKRIRSLVKDNKGSMVIEVSLAIVIIMGLFIGFIVYTNAMRYQLVMTMAAKEGARTYMVTYKKYNNISKSKEEAKKRAEAELIIGGVPGAIVTVGDKDVVITKQYGGGDTLLNLKTGASFHEEEELKYFY